MTDSVPDFTVHKAAAALVSLFIDGRCYYVVNPYSRPEVKDALKALAPLCGTDDYLSDFILPSAAKGTPVQAALGRLVQVLEDGRNYDTLNPYSRPEVKGMLQVLAEETGVSDWMDHATIFRLIEHPEAAVLQRAALSKEKDTMDARIAVANEIFATTKFSKKVSTIGQWEPYPNTEKIFIWLGVEGASGEISLGFDGIFKVEFEPGTASVTQVEARYYPDGGGDLLTDASPHHHGPKA